jgi:predicted nucleic acid-binding protein
MVESQAERQPLKVVLDTNIFIQGFRDLAAREATSEAQILRACTLRKGEVQLIFSAELMEQILRVARRLKGKDWAGLLRYLLLADYNISLVSDVMVTQLKAKHQESVPRKDLGIFAAALAGEAKVLISANRKFLKQAAEHQALFRCLEPTAFVQEFLGISQ